MARSIFDAWGSLPYLLRASRAFGATRSETTAKYLIANECYFGEFSEHALIHDPAAHIFREQRSNKNAISARRGHNRSRPSYSTNSRESIAVSQIATKLADATANDSGR
jgi:hypothetical protein